MHVAHRNPGRLILAAGSVVAAVAGAVALRADLMVGYGFARALEIQKPVRPFELAARGDALRTAQVGDEDFWLTHNEFQLSVHSVGRIAVGQRITIAGRDGRALRLEVIALSVPLIKTAAGMAPAGQVEVTGRVLNPAHEGQEQIRVVIKIEEPKPSAVPGPQDPVGRT
jgi:hypothetical protein